MVRNRASAKQAGTRMETLVSRYLAEHVSPGIERRRLMGVLDKGDLSGVTINGHRVVVEVKDYGGKYQVGPWLDEVERERINDNAAISVVVAKRRGTTDPAEQVVFMTLADLAALLTDGERP